MPRPELQMIGHSTAIGEMKAEIACAAASNVAVLITGEAGSGKELVARLIHQRSHEASAGFITVACTDVADADLASELIGHAGVHSGTLFLKGVGDMGRRTQDLLFSLLTTAEPRVRFVVSTSRDLYADVVEGRLREDLYYRLNAIHVVVAPLRDRLTDVEPLVEHFLDAHGENDRGARPRVTAAVVAALVAYQWPGNVRELKEVVEQLARTASGPAATIDDLPPRLSRTGLDTYVTRRRPYETN